MSGPEQPADFAAKDKVKGVFDQVADRYDLMNDLMSLGTQRFLKRMLVEFAAVRPGHKVLDIATGTGDVAALLARKLGETGLLVASDINASMLEIGRDRLLDAGITGEARFLQSDAEQLPFAESSVDRITMAFGLRNLADKQKGLGEFHRVLKPGGRLVVLEFSHPPFAPLASAFALFRKTWPPLGKLVTGSGESYTYLDESISRHPDQGQLLDMLETAGFVRTRCHNLLGGVTALHLGIKP